MDELPPHARELIRRARGLDDCPDATARLRVREGVSNALREPGLASSLLRRQGNAGGRVLSGLGAKVAATTAALTLVGAALAFRPERPSTPASGGATRPQVTEHEPQTTEPVVRATPLEQPRPRGTRSRLAVAAAEKESARDTLDREVALLRQVGEAVAQRAPRRARKLLEQHRARFPHPALLEERQGFHAILRCMEHAPDAAKRAHLFTARYPHSVLTPRVEQECERQGDAR